MAEKEVCHAELGSASTPLSHFATGSLKSSSWGKTGPKKRVDIEGGGCYNWIMRRCRRVLFTLNK